MRFHNSMKQAAAVATSLLLGLLLPACSDSGSAPELPEEPQLCTVTISLQAPDGMHTVTKADTNKPEWEEEEELYERNITNWLVVAYDQAGNYAGHLTAGSYDKDDKNSTTPVTKIQLPKGTYTFYAFANLESLENGESAKSYVMSGVTAEDAVQVGDIDAKFNVAKDKKLIPMSSYGYTVELNKDTGNEVEIPLIRMIGKVRVIVTNGLKDKEEAVSLTQVTIGNFQNQREIYLLPYPYGGDGGVGVDPYYLEFRKGFDLDNVRAPSFPGTSAGVWATKEYNLVDAEQPVEVTSDKATTLTCYVNESMLSSATDKSGMTITVTRGISTGVATTTHLTDFDFVRRNDLLEIPIVISDLSSRLSFRSLRLPIGVYPTEIDFGGGTGIQILTPVTYTHQYAGDLEIKYELSAQDGWKIRYKPTNGTIVSGTKYSDIRLLYNSSNLLIDENGTPLSTPVEIDFTSQGETSGSFTIRSQELANRALAQIKLTLIVEYGEGREIEIPYTINIQNKEKDKDKEGGNS